MGDDAPTADHAEQVQGLGSEPEAADGFADRPIRTKAGDVLGRSDLAVAFADHVLELDVSEGLVVGVLGPWGSGKTSFLNLARPRLEGRGVVLLDFNPWMFGGGDQLVSAFFAELSAQLRVRKSLSGIGESLGEYGEALSALGWIPIAGPWLDRFRLLLAGVRTLAKKRDGGIAKQKEKIEQALAKLELPVVVILDDIDRLTTSETRAVFRLIRLTASFPNVIYLVAFDRGRVERALEEDGVPGRDYLEKILQLAVDLPAAPEEILQAEILRALEGALAGVKGSIDQNAWPDIFMEIIRPLVRNMRDVRRYVAAARVTARDLDGQVALGDVLGLEAVRVFLPDVFGQLRGAVEGLTSTSDARDAQEKARLKEQMTRLVEAGKERAHVVDALLQRLFPASAWRSGVGIFGRARSDSAWKPEWLRGRRVAHEHVLLFYLERTNQGLRAFSDAERARALLADRVALGEYLRSLGRERMQQVVSSLEVFEEQFRPEDVIPGCTELLNLLPELPEHEHRLFEFGPALAVSRVVLRLLRKLPPEAVEAAVEQILTHVTTWNSKRQLLRIVGHEEGVGHQLLSKEAWEQLEERWRMGVCAAGVDALGGERDLLGMLLATKTRLEIPVSAHTTLGLLRAAHSVSTSVELGSRAVERHPRLWWDGLVEVYGGPDRLAARVAELDVTQLKDIDAELVALARRYVQGGPVDAR